jgi:hypothetical protein
MPASVPLLLTTCRDTQHSTASTQHGNWRGRRRMRGHARVEVFQKESDYENRSGVCGREACSPPPSHAPHITSHHLPSPVEKSERIDHGYFILSCSGKSPLQRRRPGKASLIEHTVQYFGNSRIVAVPENSSPFKGSAPTLSLGILVGSLGIGIAVRISAFSGQT